MATSLSEAYRDTNLQPQHIIPLNFESINHLPDSHTWTTTTHHHTCVVDESQPAIVPAVIDLTAPDAVELIGDACRRWGMFQVTNHGVPSSLIDDAERHARRLFALPAHWKLRTLRSPGGATGYGVARISPFFPKLMWHEGFTIMGGSAVEHAKELWPDHYQEFW